MEITIHRGAHQIGGCVTEITSGDTRIFIDFGSELPGDGVREPGPPLSIPGLTDGKPRCDGVFFTHTHGDHIGEMGRIDRNIPLYMGEVGQKMQLTLCRQLEKSGIDRKSDIAALERARKFEAAEPIPVGSLTVTPFFVDHSAYDAYMFLIKENSTGLRVLHTGDFRGHGFRGGKLIPMLSQYVGQVDWLICEGTMLSRGGEEVLTEPKLQQKARELLARHKRLFVLCSSMNIDRIAAFVHAVSDRRVVVCDRFQKDILNIAQEEGARHTHLYDFSRVRWYGRNLDEAMEKYGFLCFIRANDFFKDLLERHGEGAKVIYSMWSGYLKGNTKNDAYVSLLEGRDWEALHTSGHATPDTLLEVCRTVRPRRGVIPIHTEAPENFPALLGEYTVRPLSDGETFAL